jgi:hypothetical protein
MCSDQQEETFWGVLCPICELWRSEQRIERSLFLKFLLTMSGNLSKDHVGFSRVIQISPNNFYTLESSPDGVRDCVYYMESEIGTSVWASIIRETIHNWVNLFAVLFRVVTGKEFRRLDKGDMQELTQCRKKDVLYPCHIKRTCPPPRRAREKKSFSDSFEGEEQDLSIFFRSIRDCSAGKRCDWTKV